MKLTQRDIDRITNEIWPDPFGKDKPIEYDEPQSEGEILAQRAYNAMIEKKKYEQIESECLKQLKALADNKTTQFGDFELQKFYRAGTIDYSIIPELKSVSLENYRKENIVCWRLTKI